MIGNGVFVEGNLEGWELGDGEFGELERGI